MPSLKHFDHVSLTVTDLEPMLRFFLDLGFELEGRSVVEGDFIETVIALPDARCDIAMLRPPGGGTAIELSRFLHPASAPGTPGAPITTLGLRSLGFEVTGLDALLSRIQQAGYALVGGVGEFQRTWRMAHVRGPEGVIVALAERV